MSFLNIPEINPWVATSAIIFLGVFTQSLVGFGSALVVMGILPGLIGVEVSVPLVALVGLTLELILLVRYRNFIQFRVILPLILAAYVGIPFGVWALSRLPEDVFLIILGVVLSTYAVYALIKVQLPRLTHPGWGYLAGFLAGLLGGAYNTSGPPVIIYGNAKNWPLETFKSNLQGFFLFSNVFVVANHLLQQNMSRQVGLYYLWALPAIGLGVLVGTSLDRYINPMIFRRIVLLILLGLGIRMILAV